jgi:hypothetical protein
VELKHMPSDPDPTRNPLKFLVTSVEKVEAPEGMPEGKCYRYVISHGKSQIEGVRAGTLKAVTKHAEEYAEHLNTRGTKIYTPYASRTRKPT